MLRFCKKCLTEKDQNEFYKSNGRYRGACKDCTKKAVKAYKISFAKDKVDKYRKEYYEKNREKILENQKKIRSKRKQTGDRSHIDYMKNYNANPVNRAKWLHKRAMVRNLSRFGEFTLSLERVTKALILGNCERTGVRFDFNPHPRYHYNPLSPSIDRVDSGKGYTDENCQIVCTFYNLAKSEMSDDELFSLCKKFVEFAEKGSGND